MGRVCEKLGHVMFRDIDSDLVQQLIFDMAKEGYSKRAMEKPKIVIGSMLKMAAAKHYLDMTQNRFVQRSMEDLKDF